MNTLKIEKAVDNILYLKKIIKASKLTPNYKENELNSFCRYILTQLNNQASLSKISSIINDEFTVNYNLTTNIYNTNRIATKIFNWWNLKTTYAQAH
ncbi:hypothetical protein [Pontimicrobium sp. IMCC45349]|uniref:hypothetical protein n=1 Tax=Pontimicrobium sp. IMCC45349 TaxID=3391574 RepID=UPI0039A379DE